MDKIQKLLIDVQSGEVAIEDAMEVLRDLPFEDLGYAKIDHHRELRSGFPEVIFCPGKTPEQVAEIFVRLASQSGRVLATRADEEYFRFVAVKVPGAKYNPIGKTITYCAEPIIPNGRGKIAVVTAGTSDLPVAEEAAETALIMGNEVERIYDVGVAGVHRLFSRLDTLRAAEVLIVIAGMEGALASVVGGLVYKPIIAVPTSVGYGASFGGLSALLGMLTSCASGVTVVNIDNGFGAAYAASLINHLGV